MGWFKRNLFFAIGVLVALGLLAAAGFYDYKSWSHNQKAFADLNEVYNTAEEIWPDKKPSPGNGKTNNIDAAKDQDRQLRQWISETTNYFQPIAAHSPPANGG